MSAFPRHDNAVVVGVDGSAESAAALRFAARYADRTGEPLRIVTAYPHPNVGAEVPVSTTGLYEALEDDARTRARRVIDDVLGGAAVDHVVAAGSIDRLLREQSADASLIVVGTRQAGAWRQRLRSSLTNRITGRVDCPVISVPLERAPVAA